MEKYSILTREEIFALEEAFGVQGLKEEKEKKTFSSNNCPNDCCRNGGCIYSPDYFGEISYEILKKELEKGKISIATIDKEKVEGDLDGYILRVRNQNSPIVDTCYGKRTPCILLNEDGCKLDYEHRPAGRTPIPGYCEGGCQMKYDIKRYYNQWKPYFEILHQLKEYFKDKKIPYEE